MTPLDYTSVVQLLSHVWLLGTPWTVAHQVSLSITNSWSLLKLMFIELVMPSNHLILCHPLLLPPSIFPSIRVFSKESVLHIGQPKSHHFMSNRQGSNGNVTDFIFLDSKITADGYCSHEIKRRLLLGRKVMINLDSILKTRDIPLPTKFHLVKALVFPVIMYGCESWTIKKTEHQRIDVFEVWFWRRLLRVPLDCKEIKPVNPKGNQS